MPSFHKIDWIILFTLSLSSYSKCDDIVTEIPSQTNDDTHDQTAETNLEVPDYPDEGEWDREVYTTRHFDDLVLPTTFVSDVVQHATMLVLHTPDCSGEEKYSDLPPQMYVYFIKHDWETSPLHIPFSLDGANSLYERYQPQTCPTILYFPLGGSVYKPDIYDVNEGSVVDWIWNKLLIHITVYNNIMGTISLALTGPGPAFDRILIYQGESLGIDVYVSYLLTVTWYIGDELQPKFLFGKEFTFLDNNTQLVMDDQITMSGYSTENDWLLQKQGDIWKMEDKILQRQFSLAEIYLMNFKQAILLPKFTTTGYEKRDMPEGLKEALNKHYEHSSPGREVEQWNLDPVINDNEVKCTIVPLSSDMEELVFSVLKPIAEKWCGKDLRPTAIYGIREYYSGNVLRHHVDRPATHVISVQLPVYIDNNNADCWPFEMINHLGDQVAVNISMGEMLLYESASVIHGRTKPFQGNVYASAYVHFQPEYDWLWSEQLMGKRQKRFLVNGLNYEFIEPLYVFATEATRRRHIKFQDEL